MEMIDRDGFAAELGTAFILKAAEEHSFEVELITVSEPIERPTNRSFSILFQVPAGHAVDQGLYDLEHKRLGSMQLFLVPVGDNRLEAVFNLLTNASRD